MGEVIDTDLDKAARIRVIDLESTHTNPAEGGICEIGYNDVVATNIDLAGNACDWEVREGHARLCNPGCPIPPETRAIHHISDEDVAGLQDWRSLFYALLRKNKGDGVIALGAHGADFELQWIHEDWVKDYPVPMIDTYKVALRVWPEAPGHSNQTLRYCRMPVGLDQSKGMPPHRAGPDSYVTAFTLRDLLNEGHTIEQMVEWSKLPALQVKCMIGDYRNDGKGTPWSEVEPSYLDWIVNKAGFYDKPDVRFTAQHWLSKHEMDQREERERQALNAQFRANGLPVDGEPEPNPLTDERQEALPL